PPFCSTSGHVSMRFTLRITAVFAIAGAVVGYVCMTPRANAAAMLGQPNAPANRPWPPDLQRTASDSRPLSPAAALKTFYLPPGSRLELGATEPLVQDPVAIDWDTQGRLWVVEMPGYMRDIAGSHEHDPTGRVVVLEDRDNDGTMDTRTVFA